MTENVAGKPTIGSPTLLAAWPASVPSSMTGAPPQADEATELRAALASAELQHQEYTDQARQAKKVLNADLARLNEEQANTEAQLKTTS